MKKTNLSITNDAELNISALIFGYETSKLLYSKPFEGGFDEMIFKIANNALSKGVDKETYDGVIDFFKDFEEKRNDGWEKAFPKDKVVLRSWISTSNEYKELILSVVNKKIKELMVSR